MIINKTHEPVLKSSQEMTTAVAKISMTPEMFHLLSSGMYTYKVRAVIREICTNGVDAHKEAGIPDRPIRVGLPTIFTQELVMRDFGTGLTKEQVMNNYLNYGYSTKSNTNDLIGAMGIGCKSPFSYCDAFTVESIQNKRKSVYSIYKENGVPNVTLLVEDLEVDEEDGFCVRVPIEKQDIDHVNNEAEYVFETFDVYPEITDSARDIERRYLNDKNTVVKNEKYTITKGEVNSGTRLYAVMGQIRYPLQSSDFKFSEPVKIAMEGCTLWLNLKIGDAQVAGSRESLQLTEDTKQAVQGVLDNVGAAYVSELQSKLDKVKTKEGVVDFVDNLLGGKLLGHDSWFLRNSPAYDYYMRTLTWKGKSLYEVRSHALREIRRQKTDQYGRPVTKPMTMTMDDGQVKTWDEPIYFTEYHFRHIDQTAMRTKAKTARSSSAVNMGFFSKWKNEHWADKLVILIEDCTTKVALLKNHILSEECASHAVIFSKEHAHEIPQFIKDIEWKSPKVLRMSDYRDKLPKRERTKPQRKLVNISKVTVDGVVSDVTFDEDDLDTDFIPAMMISARGIMFGDEVIFHCKGLSECREYAAKLAPLLNMDLYLFRAASSEHKKVEKPLYLFGSREFHDNVLNLELIHRTRNLHMAKTRLYSDFNQNMQYNSNILRMDYDENREEMVFASPFIEKVLQRFGLDNTFRRYNSKIDDRVQYAVMNTLSWYTINGKRVFDMNMNGDGTLRHPRLYKSKQFDPTTKKGYDLLRDRVVKVLNILYQYDHYDVNSAVKALKDVLSMSEMLREFI